MSKEWGPWQEHDGKGCPCVGAYAEIDWVCRARGVIRGTILPRVKGDGWTWTTLPPVGKYGAVIRYRIRKPRALLDLIDLVENLPAPVAPKVDA